MVFVGAQLGEERVGDDLALAAFDGVVVADGAAFLDDAVGGVAGVFEVAVFGFGECLCSMVLRPVERLVFSPKER